MKKEVYTIYKAEGTIIELKIRDKDGDRIGTLTIDLEAQNALSWLRKNKKEPSRKNKTLLNLVDWLEG